MSLDRTESMYGPHGQRSANETEADPEQSGKGPGRAVAVRLVFAGHTDPSVRPTEAIPLDGVHEKMLSEIPQLDELEFGAFSGDIQEEYYYVGFTRDRNHDRAKKAALGNGPDITEWADTDEDAPVSTGSSADTDDGAPVPTGRSPESIAQKMRDIIDTGTPPTVTATVCELDLTPLGMMPRPTSRLLVTENIEFTKIDVASQSALYEIVTTLYKRGIPHHYACLTTPGGKNAAYDYLGTCRLVVFGTDTGIITNADTERFVETIDDDFRLSSYFSHRDIIDNFDLPVEEHLRQARETSYVQPVEQADDLSGRKTTVRDLKAGLTEYFGLLYARRDSDQRYRELFKNYGVFKLNKRDLLQFHVAVPLFYEHSLWGLSATADGGQFITHELGTPTEGTRQTYGTEHPGDSTRPLNNTDEESDEHQENVSDWVIFLIRNGHEIIWIDQDDVDVDFDDRDPTQHPEYGGPSCPDIVSKKDGQIYFHEIEIHNKSKPSQFLENLARAAYNEYPVYVVTASKKEAKQKFINGNDADRMGPTRESWKDVDAKGVIEYNMGAVEPEANVTVVLPEGFSESRWRRTPVDIHQLLVDGKVVAEGPVNKSADTYTYDLPRVRKQGSAYVLESPTGGVIREQPTKEAALGGLTTVRKPFSSPAWSFESNVTVMYRSGDEFHEYEFTPGWASRYRNSHRRRYEAAAHEFIERVTIESEGDSISMQKLRTLFLEWYRTQTDCKEPDETWFGRAVSECGGGYEIDRTDTRNKTLENRQFIFTEGIYSPDLSFIDDE